MPRMCWSRSGSTAASAIRPKSAAIMTWTRGSRSISGQDDAGDAEPGAGQLEGQHDHSDRRDGVAAARDGLGVEQAAVVAVGEDGPKPRPHHVAHRVIVPGRMPLRPVVGSAPRFCSGLQSWPTLDEVGGVDGGGVAQSGVDAQAEQVGHAAARRRRWRGPRRGSGPLGASAPSPHPAGGDRAADPRDGATLPAGADPPRPDGPPDRPRRGADRETLERSHGKLQRLIDRR